MSWLSLCSIETIKLFIMNFVYMAYNIYFICVLLLSTYAIIIVKLEGSDARIFVG